MEANHKCHTVHTFTTPLRDWLVSWPCALFICFLFYFDISALLCYVLFYFPLCSCFMWFVFIVSPVSCASFPQLCYCLGCCFRLVHQNKTGNKSTKCKVVTVGLRIGGYCHENGRMKMPEFNPWPFAACHSFSLHHFLSIIKVIITAEKSKIPFREIFTVLFCKIPRGD